MNLKNYKLFVGILVFLLIVIFYFYFIKSFNHFGGSNDRFINLLEVYDDIPSESVIFFGDSQIKEDIDCSIIEPETYCFNLGIDGILPTQIALQKDIIISTKPKVIIFGTSPLFFNEDINKNDDLYFFMSNLKEISSDKFILERLNDKEKKLISTNRIGQLLYKRKFILSYYINLIKSLIFSEGSVRQIENNFKDPYLYTQNQDLKELNKKLENPEILDLFKADKSSKRQREVFEYLVKSLRESGIDIVILQLPLNPLLRNKLHKESMENYHDYLFKLAHEYNLSIINAEEYFSKEYFIDLTHLNNEGRKELTLNISRRDYNVI